MKKLLSVKVSPFTSKHSKKTGLSVYHSVHHDSRCNLKVFFLSGILTSVGKLLEVEGA